MIIGAETLIHALFLSIPGAHSTSGPLEEGSHYGPAMLGFLSLATRWAFLLVPLEGGLYEKRFYHQGRGQSLASSMPS